MTFQQKFDKIVKKNNSLLCIGLDPVWGKLPQHIRESKQPFFTFNKAIINATHDLVCCYKPNSAFYEALGQKGIGELKKTCDYLQNTYPEIPIILDAKRGDIGSSNEGYVAYVFDYLGADAVTLHPYLGREALQPFLQRKEKGCIILCKTSNPGSGEFQDIVVQKQPLYKLLAKKIVREWNTNNNCLMVVGATYPQELSEVRKIAKNMTFLVPGIGTQGGDIGQAVRAGLTNKNDGIIIASTREIIYAASGKDFAQKARAKALEMQTMINTFRV